MANKQWLYDMIPDVGKKPITSYKFYRLIKGEHIYLVNKWDSINPDYIYFYRDFVEFNHFIHHRCLEYKPLHYVPRYETIKISTFGGVVVFYSTDGLGLPLLPILSDKAYVRISGSPSGVRMVGSISLLLSCGDVRTSVKQDKNTYEIHLRGLSLPQNCQAGFARYIIDEKGMEKLSPLLDVDYVEDKTVYYKDTRI